MPSTRTWRNQQRMSRAAAHSSESNLFLCAPGSAVIPVRKKHAEVSRPQACRRRFFPRHSEPAPECFSDGRSPTGHPIANSEIVELAPPAKALSGGDIYRFICVVTALGFFLSNAGHRARQRAEPMNTRIMRQSCLPALKRRFPTGPAWRVRSPRKVSRRGIRLR
jgi:hypothetical protein